MPQYSVLLIEQNPSNPKWTNTTLRVKAVSAKHAMQKAARKINEPRRPRQHIAKSARLYKTDHDYWRKVWKKAYDNVPTRMRVIEIERWVPQKRNATPLPVFIREEVHGRMRQNEDGTILKKEVERHAYKIGAEAALTRLLGYARWNKQNSMAHNSVCQAMVRGSRPETKERRDLLLKLAGPDGTRIAAEMLGRQFQPLKIKPK